MPSNFADIAKANFADMGARPQRSWANPSDFADIAKANYASEIMPQLHRCYYKFHLLGSSTVANMPANAWLQPMLHRVTVALIWSTLCYRVATMLNVMLIINVHSDDLHRQGVSDWIV